MKTRGKKQGGAAEAAQPEAGGAAAGADDQDELERLLAVLDEHVRSEAHDKVVKSASEILVRLLVARSSSCAFISSIAVELRSVLTCMLLI